MLNESKPSIGRFARLTAIGTWASQALNLLLMLAWAHYVGVTVFAALVVVQAVLAVPRGFFQRGMDVFIYQVRVPTGLELERWMGQQITVACIAMVVLCLGAGPLTDYFGQANYYSAFLIIGLSCPLLAAGDFRQSVLSRELRAKPVQLARLLGSLSQHVFAVLWYMLGDAEEMSLAYGFIAASVLTAVAVLLPSWESQPKSLRLNLGSDTAVIRFYTFTESVLYPIRAQLDVLMLAPLVGATSFATYAFVRRGIWLGRDVLLRPLESLALSGLARGGREQIADSYLALHKLGITIFLVLLPISVVIGVALLSYFLPELKEANEYALSLSLTSGAGALAILAAILATVSGQVRASLGFTILSCLVLVAMYQFGPTELHNLLPFVALAEIGLVLLSYPLFLRKLKDEFAADFAKPLLVIAGVYFILYLTAISPPGILLEVLLLALLFAAIWVARRLYKRLLVELSEP